MSQEQRNGGHAACQARVDKSEGIVLFDEEAVHHGQTRESKQVLGFLSQLHKLTKKSSASFCWRASVMETIAQLDEDFARI